MDSRPVGATFGYDKENNNYSRTMDHRHQVTTHRAVDRLNTLVILLRGQ